MRITRVSAVAAAAATVCALAAACGGGSSSGGSSGSSGSSGKPATITYWASDQGSSIADDYTVLNPELAKFKKQTGIKVKLEVVGWADLLNRILAATTSGQGPDVVNIGNTWSASLQATGAFLPWTSQNLSAIGGESKFVSSALGLYRRGRQAAGRGSAVLGRLRACTTTRRCSSAGRHLQPAGHLG